MDGDAADRAGSGGRSDCPGPRPLGRTVMIQGTASHVGKSWFAAGVCRILAQDGWRVRPFKAQNMSNNAAVAADGGEIGRAQALQAEAAGVPAHTDMNPVLLKPSGPMTSQVVLRGRPAGFLRFGAAGAASELRARAWSAIGDSLARLRAQADAVVIEGAGSPAELNLRDHDLANMAIARLADAPVILVADIDRGGVFAALLGTLDLLRPAERARVAGLVVNRFRGDPALFADGCRILTERSGLPVLGVVPWLDLDLPEEDAAVLDVAAPPGPPRAADVRVAVLRVPHISNFTDFAALAAVPGVALTYADRPGDAADADCLILPGTRNAAADLRWVAARGWGGALARAPLVLGVCGGMQMLGTALHDPDRVEDPTGAGDAPGLGLLPVETTYRPGKRVVEVEAAVDGPGVATWMPRGAVLSGYEIRSGVSVTAGDWLGEPGLSASAEGGRVLGCYMHGLFDNSAFRQAVVQRLRRIRGLPPLPAEAFVDSAQRRAESLDALAAAVRRHCDQGALYRILGLPGMRCFR